MNLIKKYCINFMNIINKNVKFIVMALKENNRFRKVFDESGGGTGAGVGLEIKAITRTASTVKKQFISEVF